MSPLADSHRRIVVQPGKAYEAIYIRPNSLMSIIDCICGSGFSGLPGTLLKAISDHFSVNEFYKKGCQEKTPPRPEGEIFSRDPAHCSFATVEKFGWLSILVGFLC